MGFFKVNFKETISMEFSEGASTNTSKGSPIFRKCVINIKKFDLCNWNTNRVESFNSMNGIDRGTRMHIKGIVGVEHQ
jgi:hypothetical protein